MSPLTLFRHTVSLWSVLAALCLLTGLSESFAAPVGEHVGGQGYPKAAPFTNIRFLVDPATESDVGAVEIEVEGRWLKWTSINDTTTASILQFTKTTYKEGLLEKRIAEDLVEVLTLMNAAPEDRVTLSVVDLESGKADVLQGVEMTYEKRRQVWRNRNMVRGKLRSMTSFSPASVKTKTAAVRYPKVAPFTNIRWTDEATEVEVNGQWHTLLSLDGVDVKELTAQSKRVNGRQWKKRIAEDLVELMAGMDHELGSAVDLMVLGRDGHPQVLPNVPMTEENRSAARKGWKREEAAARQVDRVSREHAKSVAPDYASLAREWPARASRHVTRKDAMADLDQLEAALLGRHAYVKLKNVDLGAALDTLRLGLPELVDRPTFTLRLQEAVSLLGDGHAGVRGFRRVMGPRGHTPFLMESSEAGVVAFKADRSVLIDEDAPYVAGLDGVPLSAWLAAASRLTTDAAPQLRTSRSLRLLRELNYYRSELGLPLKDTLTVQLKSHAGGQIKELSFPVAERRPSYREWPRTESRVIDGNVGYLRLPRMDGGDEFAAHLAKTMDDFKDTRGLIIDVRGNGGGRRDALRSLLPYFLGPKATPRVVNVAAYRLPEGEAAGAKAGYMANRYLYPKTWDGWSKDQLAAIISFEESFRPEWTPTGGAFSAWHYMVVGGQDDLPAFHYGQPVVILQDEYCFSATDIFLGGFEGLRRVTSIGAPSSGGSARSQGIELAHTGIELRFASMASFRPSGRLYDTRGVAPEILVLPQASYFVGQSDAALDRALHELTGGS